MGNNPFEKFDPKRAQQHVEGVAAWRYGDKWSVTEGIGGIEASRRVSLVPSFRQRLLNGDVQGFSPRTEVQGVAKQAEELKEAREKLDQIGDFRLVSGFSWTLTCTNEQTHNLVALGAALGGFAVALSTYFGVTLPVAALLLVKISGTLAWIETVNGLGGNNGVIIIGTLDSVGILVVPRLMPGQLVHAVEEATIAAAGRTVVELLVAGSAYAPQLAAMLQIPIVARAFSLVSSGTPLGWALSYAIGLALGEIVGQPDPDEHGTIRADRQEAHAWEGLIVEAIDDKDTFALLSHVGFLSARGGGGSAVFANRTEVGSWERWTMVHNPNNTISLRSSAGSYLVTEDGGGKECNANRNAIGSWEQFEPVALPDGKVALRTFVKKTFVSVQP